jgi:hypothetical protein
MIFSIFIPYSFILERWYLVTWSTSLGGERQYSIRTLRNLQALEPDSDFIAQDLGPHFLALAC